MPSRVQAQLAIDEEVIEDPELLSALEERLRAADDLAEIRGVYKSKHEAVTGALARHEIPLGGAFRVGRFRITRTALPARHVEFDAEASDRVRIALVDE